MYGSSHHGKKIALVGGVWLGGSIASLSPTYECKNKGYADVSYRQNKIKLTQGTAAAIWYCLAPAAGRYLEPLIPDN